MCLFTSYWLLSAVIEHDDKAQWHGDFTFFKIGSFCHHFSSLQCIVLIKYKVKVDMTWHCFARHTFLYDSITLLVCSELLIIIIWLVSFRRNVRNTVFLTPANAELLIEIVLFSQWSTIKSNQLSCRNIKPNPIAYLYHLLFLYPKSNIIECAT